MTHPIVEKVELVLMDNIDHLHISQSRIAAKAAVLATIDALMEPSEEMIEAGFNRPYIEYGDRDNCVDQNTYLTWQTMLTQAKKEIEDEL